MWQLAPDLSAAPSLFSFRRSMKCICAYNHTSIIPKSSYLQSCLCWCSSNSASTAFPSSFLSCSGSRTEPSPATPPWQPGNPYWPAWCSCPCLPDTASWSWSVDCISGPGYSSRWPLNSPLVPGGQTRREWRSLTWRRLAHLWKRMERCEFRCCLHLSLKMRFFNAK